MTKKIILFKIISDDYHQAFTVNNYDPIFVEPLQFIFKNELVLNEKLSKTTYDGLILTSPRSIEAVHRSWDLAKLAIWKTKKIYTVGHISGEKIKDVLQMQPLGTSSGNSENLAKLICNEDKATSFLFPGGNLRSDTILNTLQANNINVDSVSVYDTQENDKLRTNLIELNNCEPSASGLVFFSPSGCEYVHRQLRTFSNKLSSMPHFAIGNSTAQKIENLGYEVSGVASKPTAQSVVGAVNSYFESLESKS